jgi:CheY-like chemotaxis protein
MKTILLVDDEFGITDVLGDVLAEKGFSVIVARNGSDGLRRVEERRPDLILLDYMMPVMDGCEVLRILAAHEEQRNIPVVLMSALPRESIAADCQSAGFLRKPFDLDTLFSELSRLLGAIDTASRAT